MHTTMPPRVPATDSDTEGKLQALWHRAPSRWEELEVNVWEGSLAGSNTSPSAPLPASRPCSSAHTTRASSCSPRPRTHITRASPRLTRRPPHTRAGATPRSARTASSGITTTSSSGPWTSEHTAGEWGYELLEIGGLWRAVEEDEWGRDAKLG